MPKFKVFVVGEDEKCGSCNWRVAKTYLMAETKEDAMEAWKENEAGLCGDCFVEMLIEAGYQVDTDKPQTQSKP